MRADGLREAANTRWWSAADGAGRVRRAGAGGLCGAAFGIAAAYHGVRARRRASAVDEWKAARWTCWLLIWWRRAGRPFRGAAAAPVTAPGPYANLIHAAAQKHGLDEDLIGCVIAMESNFNPRAVSRRQALGLMQLLPQTAAHYSVADIFDPAQNIDAGTHYLKDLLTRYRGNLTLALAAYNAGPEMVERYGGMPPFAETQKYVRVITAHVVREKNASTTN